MATRIELADLRLNEFRQSLMDSASDDLEAFSPKRIDENAQLEEAARLALQDDGQLGPNDRRPLDTLAIQLGRPEVVPLIDSIAKNYQAPPLKKVAADAPYATRVVSFKPGPGAFSSLLNTRKHPRLDLTLGAPEGLGKSLQSLDVVTLGRGGRITLALGTPATRGLTVFGNPFVLSGTHDTVVFKPAKVEVSSNGRKWTELGLAGFQPVFANSENHIDATTTAAGGDRFSFAKAGIATPIHYVRLTDVSARGDGFALDAVLGR